MKKYIAVLAAIGCCLVFCASNVQAQKNLNEIKGVATFWDPGDSSLDLYDSGIGAELQYRNWTFDPWGLALSIGYASLDANKDSTVLGDPSLSDFQGSVDLFPLGASILYNLVDTGTWGLTLEAGLKYVIVDSGIDVLHAGVTGRQHVKMDDGVVADVGADVTYQINDQVFLTFGGGLRYDVVKASMSIPQGDLRDNVLSGRCLRAGVGVRF